MTKVFIYVKIFLENIIATELHFLEKFRFMKNTLGQKILKISMYEAPFCCTMRYSEGLLEYTQNQELFPWDCKANIIQDEFNRRFIDDKLLVIYKGEEIPIFSCNIVSENQATEVELTICN